MQVHMNFASGNGSASGDDKIVVEVINNQLQHFRNIDPPCRGMELPDGILLRHTRSRSLYFYLKTVVEDGKIKTQIHASDSPYDRQKARIGSVVTPMFEPRADVSHMQKLEQLIREWVGFVDEDPDSANDFQSFNLAH
jgi:hypothetical protein